MFEEVKNKRISEMVIDQVQQKILNGELREGDKLPSEKEMARSMNISSVAMREAVKTLEVMGVVESRHGKGNYIVNNIEDSTFKPIALSFRLSGGRTEELWEMRRLIEEFTVSKAVQRATADDINELRKIHERMQSLGTNQEKSVADFRLHCKIAEISGNKLVQLMLESISYLFDQFIEESIGYEYSYNHTYANIYKEHAELIDAIEKGNCEKALECLYQHLDEAKRCWERNKDNLQTKKQNSDNRRL